MVSGVVEREIKRGDCYVFGKWVFGGERESSLVV